MHILGESQPTIRRGYIRTVQSPPHRLGSRYFYDDNLESLPKFLQRNVFNSSKPDLRYIYLIGLISPEDEQVLEWLIEQSRPRSDEELDERYRWNSWNRSKLKRSDFEVYLTRDKAKSDSGKSLLKRLAAESVKYHVLSPSSIQDALASTPDALHASDTASLQSGLDNYLLFESNYLISKSNIVYSNWHYTTHQHTEWWQSVRDGESKIPEDKFDYSTIRLQKRGAGRITRRCDCSGQHPRCPRPTDRGPQWLCPCGGPCKRRGPCREGQSRKSHDYHYPSSRIPWIMNPNDRDHAIKETETLTAEELCTWMGICFQGGEGTRGVGCAKALESIESFSSDWKTE